MKIANAFRQFGPLDGLTYLVGRALSVASRGHIALVRYRLFAQPVPEARLTPPHRGRDITVKEATTQEIRATTFGRPDAVIEDRVSQGTRCLLAVRNGEVIGFQWFTLRDYIEDEIRCRFELRQEDACAWDFDIYVKPEDRIRPVFSRLWDDCNAILRQHGVKYSISRIAVYNTTSLRAHHSLGARAIGWICCLLIGRVQVAFKSQAPWISCSYGPGWMPKFRASQAAIRSYGRP